MSEQEDRDHAIRHAGKYSAGYNRGLARGREEQHASYEERQRYRDFLTDLLVLDQTAEVLPDDFRDRLERLVRGV